MDADEPAASDPPTDVYIAAWALAFGLLVVVASVLAVVRGWGGVTTAAVLRALAATFAVAAYYLARLGVEYHRSVRAASGDDARRARTFRNRLVGLAGLAVAAAVVLVGYLTA